MAQHAVSDAVVAGLRVAARRNTQLDASFPAGTDGAGSGVASYDWSSVPSTVTDGTAADVDTQSSTTQLDASSSAFTPFTTGAVQIETGIPIGTTLHEWDVQLDVPVGAIAGSYSTAVSYDVLAAL